MAGTRTFVFLSCLMLLGNESASINTNIEIFNLMLSDMDENANPCHNFYNSSQKNLEWGESPTVNAQFQVLFEGLKNQSSLELV